jgi:hypothetical protein
MIGRHKWDPLTIESVNVMIIYRPSASADISCTIWKYALF